MKATHLLILYFSLVSSLVFSQESGVPKINIKYGIIAKPYQDSIVLRWAPMDVNALPAHIEAGVNIDMLIVTGKYKYKVGNWQRVNKVPIKPYPVDAFNNDKSKANDYEMLVAQLLYGNMKQDPQTLNGMSKDNASMLKSLFSMAMLGCDYSPSAAEKMGARLKSDIKMKEGEKVFFRIYSAYNHPLFQIDTTTTFVGYGEWDADNTPKFLSATSQEKAIALSWPVNKDLYRWAGFYIERSSDNTNFKRLNKKPFLTITDARVIDMTFTDSVANYVPYYYRIQAIDPFGELTPYSETIKTFASDKTPPTDLTLTDQNQNDKSMILTWAFTQQNVNSDLKHFIIKKGQAVNYITDTIEIVTKNTTSYTYKFPAKTRSTYFEVIAVDTSGNARSSNPVRYFKPDTEPPLPPKNILASIDTAGIVTLSWDIDTLEELEGYRVYRTNQSDHNFVCLQQGYLSENKFMDTLSLKTLTKEVYYSVCAVDLSYNHSKKSKPIKLIKPDRVPPFPPQITDYDLKDAGIKFQWVHSPSNDVKQYHIIRMLLSDTLQKVKKTINKSKSDFEEVSLLNGEMYQYTIVAEDSSGLMSLPSFPLKIKAYANNKEKLGLQWNIEKDKIGFSWPNTMKDALFYIVYKDTGEGFTQYKSIQTDATSFMDTEPNLLKYKKIRYGLQAQYTNQAKSEIFTLDWKIIN